MKYTTILTKMWLFEISRKYFLVHCARLYPRNSNLQFAKNKWNFNFAGMVEQGNLTNGRYFTLKYIKYTLVIVNTLSNYISLGR